MINRGTEGLISDCLCPLKFFQTFESTRVFEINNFHFFISSTNRHQSKQKVQPIKQTSTFILLSLVFIKNVL